MQFSDILNLLITNAGAFGVTGLFVWYLVNKDKRDQIKDTIHFNMLKDLQKDSTIVQNKVADRLENLKDTIMEQKHILEEIYKHNMRLAEKLRKQEEVRG